MITIIKDGNKLRCSQNTYDIMYKRLGYEILNENKEPKVIKTEVVKDTAKDIVKDTVKEKVITPKQTSRVKGTKNKLKKGE